ncbi:hypothetical protein GCM10018790_48150 [Kitasatospora xanthocidica]|uniref:DUF397 domain-containing protein n=1 Tax=Kitasatospora xanthocidica TaxID=83382 RepID=UPI001676965D|nr:DUF397 domain-containing protein [Kitasatospora xanthocidica]GHF64696.1 hypothetical protein GCM10018790_48150 [Kitasatospora xanthocidica]
MSGSNWQKSSFSGSGGDCVEVRTANGTVELRESDEGHTILRTTPAALASLLHGIKAGEFDHHA